MRGSLSLDQAAARLGKSRRSIYNYINAGRLLTLRTLGGSQRVTIESIERFETVNKKGMRQPPDARQPTSTPRQ